MAVLPKKALEAPFPLPVPGGPCSWHSCGSFLSLITPASTSSIYHASHLELDSLHRSCFPKQGHIHRSWVWPQTVELSHLKKKKCSQENWATPAVACLFQKLTHSFSSRTSSSRCVYHTQTHTTFAFLVTVKKVGSHPRFRAARQLDLENVLFALCSVKIIFNIFWQEERGNDQSKIGECFVPEDSVCLSDAVFYFSKEMRAHGCLTGPG